MKHAAQGFAIDRPGTDSSLIRASGVEQTLLVGGGALAVIEQWAQEPPLEEVIARHVRPDVDLVVTEGYKRLGHPKIEVARAALATELLTPDRELLAVVCDFRPGTRAPVFAPEQADAVAALVIERVLRAGGAWSGRPSAAT